MLRAPRILRLGVPALLVILAAALSFFAFEGQSPSLPLLLSFVGALLWQVALYRQVPKQKSRVSVRLKTESIEVADARITAASVARVALIELADGTWLLRLERRALRPPVHLLFDSKRAAQRVVAALGSRRATAARDFACMSPIGRSPLAFISIGSLLSLAALMMDAAFDTGILSAFLAVLPMALLLRTLGLEKVTVGTDGIRRRWLGRESFIPLTAFDEVSVVQAKGILESRQEVVLLDDGEQVARFAIENQPATRANEMATLIRAGFELHPLVPSASTVLGSSRAQGADRIRELRRIGSGASADPRTPTMTREQLWDVVEHAPTPEDRAAAAMALSSGISEKGRKRLRAVAETSSMPRVRAALEAAADERASDDELAAVLEAVQSEAAPPRRRRTS